LLNQLQAKQQENEDKAQESFQMEIIEKEKSSDETLNALKRLQLKFDKYKNEMMKTNQALNGDIENLRKSLSEINTKYALSESKLEGMVEKCKTLNATVEKYKKECEILKERNLKFSELIVKHEQSITTINLELHKANEKKPN
jgi:nucleoprotein TPR